MSKELLLEKFNLITGRHDKDIKFDLLTSAQRARLFSWAESEGLDIEVLGATSQQAVGSKSHKNEVLESFSELAIGIDLQDQSELFADLPLDMKSDEELLSIFTPREIAHAEGRPNPAETLTGIFALKEAIVKTGAYSNQPFRFSDLEIFHGPDGKPQFDGFSVSISHSSKLAVAVAISTKAAKINEKKREIETSIDGDFNYSDDLKPQGFSKISTVILVSVISILIISLERLIVGLFLAN